MDERQFWRSVVVKPSTGCYHWTRAVSSAGYGMVSWHGKVQLAHRVAFTLSGRIIPPKYLVLHTCNHKRCICPEHLYSGTMAENTVDAIAAGRQLYNSLKTHCLNGHEFTPENTRIVTRCGRTGRQCRACVAPRARAYRARKKS